MGGAADIKSATLGNMLLGQSETLPILEIVRSPVKFQFHQDTTISLTGFGMKWSLNHEISVDSWKQITLKKDSILSGKPIQGGFRSYLCVAGGFEAVPFDDAHGTDLRLGLGGSIRALKKGDLLKINVLDSDFEQSFDATENHILKRPSIQKHQVANDPNQNQTKNLNHDQISANLDSKIQSDTISRSSSWRISHELTSYAAQRTIRILPGPELSWFNHSEVHRFMKSSWKIDSKSDRMGIRLQDGFTPTMPSKEMLSTVVFPGTVQITASGPIILFVDAQTTGGYPRIGQVCSVDLPVLAQKAPGEEIFFEWISIEQALRLQESEQAKLAQIKSAISLH
ncbi:MAG TPA: hypothetical protein DCE78_04155 [Bacteroidetes bacterium]|nr:hypothetical protein [Bacteroidota bacterium]